jgi:methionyl-tRNA synthetase
MSKTLITAALPYANGPLHFGHIAGAYLPADAFARYAKMKKNDVLFICGSDEYGVAVAMSAELSGRSPKEQVDLYHKMHKELFQKMDISFDHFSRTTWKGHAETVQEFFLVLLKNGWIEEKEEEHLFSEKENQFLADRYVLGTCPKCGFEKARGDECPKCGAYFEAKDLKNPISKLTGSPLIQKKSNHWYLKLDQAKERLALWLDAKEWKSNVTHFVKNYINDLKARAITRDAKWGIPLPLDEAKGKVFYVWFDAPIGYISATKEWAEKVGKPEAWKEYWQDKKTHHVEFIGKDNIPFHALFFPVMLMGQDDFYKTVDDLPANEFLLLEGRQFSKSDHWYIDLDHFFSKYSSDQIRYTLAANAPENQDAEFTWKDFQIRCNSDLVGKFGNFIHRTITFAHKYCSGKVPSKIQMHAQDDAFLKAVREKIVHIEQSFQKYSIRRACEQIMQLASLGNGYFDMKKPWALYKEGNQQAVDTTIYCSLECIKYLLLAAYPIIPTACDKAWVMLGFEKSLHNQKWDEVMQSKLSEGQALLSPQVLFQKVEDEDIDQEIARLGCAQT